MSADHMPQKTFINATEPPEVSKTTMGLRRLSEVVGSFRYVPGRVGDTQGLLFASIQRERAIGEGIVGSFTRDHKHTLALVPAEGAAVDHAWTRRDGRDVTAWTFIPWLQYGVALVLVNDPHHISNQWLAFVPLDELQHALIDAQAEVGA